MKRNDTRRSVRRLVGVCTIVVLAGTSLVASSANAVSPSGKKSAIDPNGTLRFGVELNNRSPQLVAFDPATSTTTNDVWNLAFIYDTLLYPPLKTGKYEPGLARSFEVVDDQTIEVELRPNLTFHDGETLDADAASASIMRNFETVNSSWNPAFANLDSIEVLSPTTFRINLTEPGAYAFLPLLAARETMVVSPTAAAAGTLEELPIGAGPFEFGEYDTEQLLSLTKFKDYWNAKKVRIGQLDLVSSVAGAPRVAALLAPTIDVGGISVSDVGGVDGRDDLKVATKPSDGFLYTQLCKSEPPFDNLKVRQAFSHAINRDELNQAVYDGLGAPAYMAWSEGTPFYEPSIAKQQKYNPKLARKLLAEAGFEDGVSFSTMIVAGFPATETLTTVLEQQLAEVGIEITIEQSANYAQDVWVDRKTDTGTVPWIRSGVENTIMFDPGFQANLCGYDDPELNDLRTAVLDAVPGSPAQHDAWTAWMKHVADNMLVIYHLYPASVIGFHSDRVDASKFDSLYSGPSAQFLDWTAMTVKKG
ncbi:MAG: ABC transporter substrate-binding protein [Actinobacteria bacterium]|nr:ABC transporter substrate-binding protein [Actinomycetota bacterium]